MLGSELLVVGAIVALASPVVEVEEDVYTYTAPDNGAGPMWCFGSTCLVRSRGRLFASGQETIEGAKPLNNVRWTLRTRYDGGWRLISTDEGRTREPSPMAAFHDGDVFLSVNPTLTPPGTEGGGPARPQILALRAAAPDAPPAVLEPRWDGEPAFTEHSYRSFAADGPNGELILFQNIGYTHAEWAFRDRDGKWAAAGKLEWPFGAEHDDPQPIRVCYPNVALRDRAVYFCGVSDIVEPYHAWRDFKRELTGREWDYDFRRLFLTACPDIRTGRFAPWLEVASRDKTCGWISPCDLYVAPDGAVHVLWTERALDERLRARFFPEAKQRHALEYAIVRDGRVTHRRTLLEAGEGLGGEVSGQARFQVTPDGRLFVIHYVSGTNAAGEGISENRVFELRDGAPVGEPVRVPLSEPFGSFFTATVRGGSPPSDVIDLLGEPAGRGGTIRYARVRLVN